MVTEQHPYELLIRWGQDGTLQGAHVQHRFVVFDGGIAISEAIGQAKPLALDGFPLADLLNKAQADALAESERMRAELAAMTGERDAALSELAALKAP